MSKFKTAYFIQREIDRLNEVIDLKIIKGFTYREEAKRHRFLRAQLADITRASRASRSIPSTFFRKTLGFVSTFLL